MSTPGSVVPITGTPNSDKIFEEAKVRGENNAARIAELSCSNSLEETTIERFERLTRHGAKSVDLLVRKDGQEYRFEADWLARLFRSQDL